MFLFIFNESFIFKKDLINFVVDHFHCIFVSLTKNGINFLFPIFEISSSNSKVTKHHILRISYSDFSISKNNIKLVICHAPNIFTLILSTSLIIFNIVQSVKLSFVHRNYQCLLTHLLVFF